MRYEEERKTSVNILGMEHADRTGEQRLNSHKRENLPKKNWLNQLVIFGVMSKTLLSLLLLRNWAELKPTGIDYVFRASYLQERTETAT